MSLSGDRLAHAEARSATARENLIDSVTALKSRLSPKRIVGDTVNEARDIGEDLVGRGIDAVTRRPGRITGSIAGVIAVLVASRIFKHRRKASRKATGVPAGRFKSKRAKAHRHRSL